MRLQITVGKNLYQVQIERAGNNFEVTVNGKPYKVGSSEGGYSVAGKVHKVDVKSNESGNVKADIDGKIIEALILDIAKAPIKEVEERREKKMPTASSAVRGGKVVMAPMPGKIVRVFVAVGQIVKVGDVLLILEAMKMENEIRSPFEGKVKEVTVSAGAGVAAEDSLVVME